MKLLAQLIGIVLPPMATPGEGRTGHGDTHDTGKTQQLPEAHPH